MKSSQQLFVQTHQVAAPEPVLPARERGLGAQRASQLLVGNDLQHRIMAQAFGVVGIFVAGDDLEDPLPQKSQRHVFDPVRLARIAEDSQPSPASDDDADQRRATAKARHRW